MFAKLGKELDIYFKEWMFKIMLRSIKWYTENDMDQWDRFQMNTKYGPIYTSISRADDPNYPGNYRKLYKKVGL